MREGGEAVGIYLLYERSIKKKNKKILRRWKTPFPNDNIANQIGQLLD